MPKVVVVEKKCLLLAEGRRVPANIDQHVVHGTVGAADQLRLARAPSARACRGLRPSPNGIGSPGRTTAEIPGCAEVVVENVRVEGPGEQSAVVAERLRDEDENVREVGLFDAHTAMLS